MAVIIFTDLTGVGDCSEHVILGTLGSMAAPIVVEPLGGLDYYVNVITEYILCLYCLPITLS